MIQFKYLNNKKVFNYFMLLLLIILTIIAIHFIIYSSISCFDNNFCLKTYCNYSNFRDSYKSVIDKYKNKC